MVVLQLGAGASLIVILSISLLWLYVTNTYTPYPFIDEELHIPAAQRYCQGNLTYWDNKITTPPGLYINALVLHTFFSWMGNFFIFLLPSEGKKENNTDSTVEEESIPYFCTLFWLRLWSYVYWIWLIIILITILYTSLTKKSQRSNSIQSLSSVVRRSSFTSIPMLIIIGLAISTFSPLWITSGFVYTDTSSILYIILSKYLFIQANNKPIVTAIMMNTGSKMVDKVINDKNKKNDNNNETMLPVQPSLQYLLAGVFCGIFSMLYRQTNILWYTYIVMEEIIPLIFYSYGRYYYNDSIRSKPTTTTTTLTFLVSFIGYLFRYYWVLLVPYLMGIYYLVWNSGSIVLGDRTAHTPVFHYTQFMYNVSIVSVYLYIELIVLWIIQGFTYYWYGTNEYNWLSANQQEWLKVIRWIIGGTGNTEKKFTDAATNRTDLSFISFSRRTILLLLLTVFLVNVYGIQHYTYIHPYLLADNRHYTFVLVQRIILPYRRYLPFFLASIATVGGLLIFTRMMTISSLLWTQKLQTLYTSSSSSSLSSNVRFSSASFITWNRIYIPLVWFIFSLFTVVPAHLFEFRYFIPSVTLGLLYIWGNEFILHYNTVIENAEPYTSVEENQKENRNQPSDKNKDKDMLMMTDTLEKRPFMKNRIRSTAVCTLSTDKKGKEEDNIKKSSLSEFPLTRWIRPSSPSPSSFSLSVLLPSIIPCMGPLLGLGLNVIVTILVMYVFYKYPFTWEDGKYIMRRIW